LLTSSTLTSQECQLPIARDAAVVDALFLALAATPGYRLRVDLLPQTILTPDGTLICIEIDTFRKHRLFNGLDDIALTLEQVDVIRAYKDVRR
jgi:3-isopropylmalate/(R)-2-methylmalate dehydratase small subunit